MNATNRALNRAILLIVGLALLAAGIAAVAAAIWSRVGDAWIDSVSAMTDWLAHAEERSRISEASPLSWLTVAVLAVLVLLIVAAIIALARLGGGRAGVVIREEAAEGAQGAVTIRQGFASDAITHSLAQHEEIASTQVSARQVQAQNVLHVSLTVVPGTSPAEAAQLAGRAIDSLAVLTGRPAPAYVSIRSGGRGRRATEPPRVR